LSSSNDFLKKIEESDKKIREFGDLLDSLATTDDKKKMLWKQIYQNAVTDRESAHALYVQLYMCMNGSAQEHSTLGAMLVKYLERMGKCNEQLIKLADMISAAEKSERLTPDEMFEAIGE
jgi:hypothetical protein